MPLNAVVHFGFGYDDSTDKYKVGSQFLLSKLSQINPYTCSYYAVLLTCFLFKIYVVLLFSIYSMQGGGFLFGSYIE
jgi:hypothetical protein